MMLLRVFLPGNLVNDLAGRFASGWFRIRMVWGLCLWEASGLSGSALFQGDGFMVDMFQCLKCDQMYDRDIVDSDMREEFRASFTVSGDVDEANTSCDECYQYLTRPDLATDDFLERQGNRFLTNPAFIRGRPRGNPPINPGSPRGTPPGNQGLMR
jgi:hypothetical protein